MASGLVQDEPVAIVQSFYGWSLDNLGYNHGQDDFHQPTKSALEERPELAEKLLVSRQEIIISFAESGGYHPLICAQDVPTSFKFE